jgi:hypothetical protein
MKTKAAELEKDLERINKEWNKEVKRGERKNQIIQ